MKFKNILSVLNIVWSTLPTLHEKWGEQLIEKTTKMKYKEYLKIVKEPEEKAFWELYEHMDNYAQTFFKKVLSMLNFLEKPKSSNGTISNKTSKLSERLSLTL